MTAVFHKSASVIVLNKAREVLFMVRPATGSYPSAHVFPGGVLEPDDKSLANCAIRETYEETGLLFVPTGQSPRVFDPVKVPFASALDTNSVDWLDDKALGLSKFTEWTTPEAINRKKRFITQFYLHALKEELSEPLKVPETGEVHKIEWMLPETALDRFAKGEITMLPPQFFLLTYLKEKGVSRALAEIGERVIKPLPMAKLKGSRLLMDWGNGEGGMLHFKGAMVRKIDFFRTAQELEKASKL